MLILQRFYQKQSPEAATEYYLDLSKELNLFNPEPSFDEHQAFYSSQSVRKILWILL